MMDGDLEFDSDLVYSHLDHHRRGTADVVMGPTCDTWRPKPSRFQKWADSRSMGGRSAGPFPWRYFKTGNISVRRDLVDCVGGFDESMIQYGGEDTELGYRLWKSGATFHWDPGIVARHQSEIDVRMHAERMITYGRTVLTYTLSKHPDIEFLLGNQWIGPVFRRPRRPSYLILRALTPILLLPAIYRATLWWAQKVGVPRFLFTYVSVGGCMIGLSGRSLDLRC
jgi:GT2 family glycosyltransferase